MFSTASIVSWRSGPGTARVGSAPIAMCSGAARSISQGNGLTKLSDMIVSNRTPLAASSARMLATALSIAVRWMTWKS